MRTIQILTIFPLLFLLFPSPISCNCQNSTYQIQLPSGTIQGRLITTDTGNTGIVFLGVPFAEPPIGHLRFRPPVTRSPWSGVLECEEYREACWQLHTAMDGFNYTGIEDCLYLNIFAHPKCVSEPTTAGCPVLYYIHGGGYDADTPLSFPPEILVDNFASKGLIMVTVQYRLNAFGFWSLGEEATGNYGMYDMIAALQWVKRNIDRFGGDPTQVTIMGHSSGSAAVSLLSLSPKTDGLFNRLIMMSGTVHVEPLQNDQDFYWALADELKCARPWQREIPKIYPAIVECMRKVDEDTLGRTFLRLQKIYRFRTSPRNDGPDGLFPLPLSQLIPNRRPYDAMMGTTKREEPFKPAENETVDSNTVATKCAQIVFAGKYQNPRSIIDHCQRHYSHGMNTSGNLTTDFWVSQIQKLIDDNLYHTPCFKEADSLRSRGSKIYLYSFDYSKRGFESSTPFHSFDLTYLIGLHPFKFDDRDRELQQVYAPLFANFAKYGNPTPEKFGLNGTYVPENSDTINGTTTKNSNFGSKHVGERRENSNSSAWLPLNSPYGFNYYSVDLPGGIMKPKYHTEAVIFWNYMVPMLENQNSMHWGGSHPAIWFRNGTSDTSGSRREFSIVRFWRIAFGLSLASLILTLVLLILFAIREIWIYKQRRSARENQRLLAFGDDQSSYQTF